jgi:catechol 2,3-dioxygenase-like lactoylglutathione lyase family enzyme
MSVTALYPVLMTDRPAALARFYAELLELEPVFEADWFVQLTGQMGFVARDHDSVPERFRGATAACRQGIPAGDVSPSAGLLVTVEVDDVDAVHERAVAMEVPIELTLRDEAWGQRHFIARDPDGTAVDVVQVIPASPEFAALYNASA